VGAGVDVARGGQIQKGKNNMKKLNKGQRTVCC